MPDGNRTVRYDARFFMKQTFLANRANSETPSTRVRVALPRSVQQFGGDLLDLVRELSVIMKCLFGRIIGSGSVLFWLAVCGRRFMAPHLGT